MVSSTSSATALLSWSSNLNPCMSEKQRNSIFPCRRKPEKRCRCFVPAARLFGPSIFEASKPSGRAVPENMELPEMCEEDCSCCFPAKSSIPWLREFFIWR